MHFDDEQLKIIYDNSKCLFVIASAGCGKSTVIVEKVRYLISKGIDPSKILLISFTNDSVNDLKSKLNNICDIKTFHKLGFDILKSNCIFKLNDNLYSILDKYFSYDIFFSDNYLNYVDYLYSYFYKSKKCFGILFDNIYEIVICFFLKMLKVDFKYKLINFNGIFSKFIFFYKDCKYCINLCYRKRIFSFNSINLYMNNFNLNVLFKFFSDFNPIIICDDEYKNFLNVCVSFINNYKSCYIGDNGFKLLKCNGRMNLFLKVIYNAYVFYEDYNKLYNYIDYNDMINKSIDYVDVDKLGYKYVIVDEFQDISSNRLKLLDCFRDKCFITTVGDDWQSIYSFTGSNLNLFVDYCKKYNSVVLPINRTYRNSQELIDIAGSFICKNVYQVKKKLVSNISIDCPIKVFFYEDDNLSLFLFSLIKLINLNSKVLLIGRNNFDIDCYIDNKLFFLRGNKVICSCLDVDITFLTAHASKGMTFDEVIIINGKNDLYGFPSYVSDNYEISCLKKNDNFYLSEERRLFYVALTRTCNCTYILTPFSNPSWFVLELIHDYNVFCNRKIEFSFYMCSCGFYSKRKFSKCINCGK